MNQPVGDEELLLCHWGDPALDPARRRAIRDALDLDPALRSRSRDLVAALEAQARSLAPPVLPRDYEARLWSRMEPRLETRPAQASCWSVRWSSATSPRQPKPCRAWAMPGAWTPNG